MFRFVSLLLSPEPCLWMKRRLLRRLLNLNTKMTWPLLRGRARIIDIMDMDTEDMEDTGAMGVITVVTTDLVTVNMDMDMDMVMVTDMDMDITDRSCCSNCQ